MAILHQRSSGFPSKSQARGGVVGEEIRVTSVAQHHREAPVAGLVHDAPIVGPPSPATATNPARRECAEYPPSSPASRARLATRRETDSLVRAFDFTLPCRSMPRKRGARSAEPPPGRASAEGAAPGRSALRRFSADPSSIAPGMRLRPPNGRGLTPSCRCLARGGFL